MPVIKTIPSYEELRDASVVPQYMNPNYVPTAVAIKDALSTEECESIVEYMMREPAYVHSVCNAVTREAPEEGDGKALNIVFDPLIEIAEYVNNYFFDFDLYGRCQAWMQTYTEGQDYLLHADGRPGQTRKLTAVLLLSQEEDYEGGALKIFQRPNEYFLPKSQGTIVVFPSWVEHRVTKVTRGTRQTINLGFWGPSFR